MRATTIAAALLVAVAGLSAAAQTPDLSGSDEAVRAALDEIHGNLTELEFEQALAGIEALLGSNVLSEADRVEALVLRAQGHVAFGDLSAAEQDYRQILSLRPGFVPDKSMTPQKAAERFKKVQSDLIGRLELRLFPEDARLRVDGREVALDADGALPLLGGEHRLLAESDGFDSTSETFVIEPGRKIELELRLRPNARTVVILTEPDGVDVTLDGVPVGRTRREEVQGIAGRSPASLRVENLSLGEHTIELSKECYRTERVRDDLDVDLQDVTPKRYPIVRMSPARSTLSLRGGPAGAQLRVDGELAGTLPLDPVELCPGSHTVEIRRGARRLWIEQDDFDEGELKTLLIAARPNVVLVGTTDWPAEYATFRSGFNLLPDPARLPRGDLADRRSWAGTDLPRDTDLVLARRQARREGDPDEWFVYSPILDLSDRLGNAPTRWDRPRWIVATWGFATVDTEVGGPTRVVQVVPRGPAALAGLSPGDRVVSVGGAPVADSGQLRKFLEAATWKVPLAIEWTSAAGEPRKAELRGAPSPRLVSSVTAVAAAALRAAWAMSDGEGAENDPDVAQANLALLYSEFGNHEAAAKIWRRIAWSENSGIGLGTAKYYLGRSLESLGEEEEAVRAYRVAAASGNTTAHNEGPPVAPAARDHLADLGVAVSPGGPD